MKNNSRISRINDEIMREVAQIIRSELKDPRIGAMTSVLRVDTTTDLAYCKIYVSVFGDDQQKSDVLEGLDNSAGYIRKLIAERINLRNTPQLKFVLDTSLEYSDKINKIISSLNQNE